MDQVCGELRTGGVLVVVSALAALVVGCETRATLTVRVQSGLRAGPEVGYVDARLHRGSVPCDASADTLAGGGRGLSVGDQGSLESGSATVAEFGGLAPGIFTVRVVLRRPPLGGRVPADGEALIARCVVVSLTNDRVVRVPLTTDCLDVSCPLPMGSPSFDQCLNGTCVDPRCDVDDPSTAEFCCDRSLPSADCDTRGAVCGRDGDCDETASCTGPRGCREGVCVEPIEDDCPAGQYCAASLDACLEEGAAPPDAGSPDAGDPGSIDAGDGGPLAGCFVGGSGSEGDPYLVADVEGLDCMRLVLDGHFRLTGDIDASETRTWNAGHGFQPIGFCPDTACQFGSLPFTGTLDGAGHRISELFIDALEDHVGLFRVTSGATVSDLDLEANITGRSGVGALIALSENTTLRDVTVTGSVMGATDAGGLVGRLRGGLVARASSAVAVSGTEEVGGLVGSSSAGARLEDCFASGTVMGTGIAVGGLVGAIGTGDVVTRSFATGDVTGGGRFVGALVGWLSGTLTESYAAGSATSSGAGNVGGLVGLADGAVISDSYATGDALGASEVGGLVGRSQEGTRISRCYATGGATGRDTGGLVGRLGADASDTSSVFAAGGGAGGVVGWSESGMLLTAAFWDRARSGATSCVGRGTAAAECTAVNIDGTAGSYFFTRTNPPLDSWDFTTVWRARAGDYPVLAWQP